MRFLKFLGLFKRIFLEYVIVEFSCSSNKFKLVKGSRCSVMSRNDAIVEDEFEEDKKKVELRS